MVVGKWTYTYDVREFISVFSQNECENKYDYNDKSKDPNYER